MHPLALNIQSSLWPSHGMRCASALSAILFFTKSESIRQFLALSFNKEMMISVNNFMSSCNGIDPWHEGQGIMVVWAVKAEIDSVHWLI